MQKKVLIALLFGMSAGLNGQQKPAEKFIIYSVNQAKLGYPFRLTAYLDNQKKYESEVPFGEKQIHIPSKIDKIEVVHRKKVGATYITNFLDALNSPTGFFSKYDKVKTTISGILKGSVILAFDSDGFFSTGNGVETVREERA